MKNNRIIILLVFILIAIAAYFYVTKSSSTITSTKDIKKDFAFEDTLTINKIFITDAKGKNVTLTRSNKDWLVDGKHVARPDNIHLLMKTFSRIAVRNPVPNAAFKNVVKLLATQATKVEIYQDGEKPSKIYYVGNSTMDQQGTYMLLEEDGVKSSVPFVMHIPGFYGFLSSRFFAESVDWREPSVFVYEPEEIKSIEVKYFEEPEESFIINKDLSSISVKGLEEGAIEEKVNPAILNEYVERYKRIFYEMADIESTQQKIDSVVNSSPFFQIKVTDVAGQTNKIVAYHMPNFRATLDADGNEFEYDLDRMYAHYNDDAFVFIQFPTFDQLTIPKSAFLKQP